MSFSFPISKIRSKSRPRRSTGSSQRIFATPRTFTENVTLRSSSSSSWRSSSMEGEQTYPGLVKRGASPALEEEEEIDEEPGRESMRVGSRTVLGREEGRGEGGGELGVWRVGGGAVVERGVWLSMIWRMWRGWMEASLRESSRRTWPPFTTMKWVSEGF